MAIFMHRLQYSRASLVGQIVKNPPAIHETWVHSLGWEDPLEEGITTHSSILSWRIPWTEEPGGLQSMGLRRVGHDWAAKHSMHSQHWELLLNQEIRKWFWYTVYTGITWGALKQAVSGFPPAGNRVFQTLPMLLMWNPKATMMRNQKDTLVIYFKNIFES